MKPLLKSNISALVLPITLMLGTLVGCATPDKVSNQPAVWVAPEGQANIAADITARYEPSLCDDGFAYIKFAIKNTGRDWLQLKNPSLVFPYADNTSDFEVVTGTKLSAWARAEAQELKAAEFNTSLVSGLALLVGSTLISEGNENAATAGSMMAGTALLGRGVEVLRDRQKDASAPVSLEENQHILAHDLMVPPQKALQYWVVVRATEDAPLMNYISLGFDVESNQRHYAVVPLMNRGNCRWQSERESFLTKWAKENSRIDRSLDPDTSLPIIEDRYQKSLQQ